MWCPWCGSQLGGGGMMGGGFGIGWILMVFFWILILAGVALLIYWLVKSVGTPSHGGAKTPLDILKERYARGEIDKKEFEERKKDLTS